MGYQRSSPEKLVAVLALVAFSRITTAAQPDPPPDPVRQQQILLLVRQSAKGYRMPDVSFDEKLTHFRAPGGSENWREEWVTEEKRIAHDGHVYVCCLARKKGKWAVQPTPATTDGKQYWTEAWYIPGSGVFPWDGSAATISWNRWEELRGKRLAVFDYSVDERDSHWIATEFPVKAKVPHSGGIPYSGPVQDVRDAVRVPYAGSIWVDPETGGIWRASDVVTRFPPRFRTNYASDVVDYDTLSLGGIGCLLPVVRTQIVQQLAERARLDSVYSNYKRFEANSTITFFSVDSSIIYRQ